MKRNGPFLIGICGGSGSGKTKVAETVIEELGPEQVLLVEQDSYYKDLAHIPFEQRHRTNFDHPSAFDNDLLIEHLQSLLAGNTVKRPEYNYARHIRSGQLIEVQPRGVILLDGILIFENQRLRDLMDIRVYIDVEADIRLARRMRRDIAKRGRTLESVLEQWEKQVRPMHDLFVEPYKRFADIIIPEGGKNRVAVEMLIARISSLLLAA